MPDQEVPLRLIKRGCAVLDQDRLPCARSREAVLDTEGLRPASLHRLCSMEMRCGALDQLVALGWIKRGCHVPDKEGVRSARSREAALWSPRESVLC